MYYKWMMICWHPLFTSFLLKLIYYLLASSESHKNPSLFCFAFSIPCYTYSTAKFWPKCQLQLTFCRSHFMFFAQNTKSFIFYLFIVDRSVPLYFLLQYFQQKIDQLILFRFWLLSTILSAKTFQQKLDKQLKADLKISFIFLKLQFRLFAPKKKKKSKKF